MMTDRGDPGTLSCVFGFSGFSGWTKPHRPDKRERSHKPHEQNLPTRCGMVPGTFSKLLGSCLKHRQRPGIGGGGPFNQCNGVGSPCKEVERCMEQFWWSTTMPTFEKRPA